MLFKKKSREEMDNEARREYMHKSLKNGLKLGKDHKISGTPDFGSEPYLITIGDHVGISRGVRFITHDGGLFVVRALYEDLRDADIMGRIVVGNNVFIGADTIIMPGVTIGNNCIIGCGAVVTRDIPDNSVAVGVPARVIETVDEYVQKNRDRFIHTYGMTAEEKKAYLLENLP